MLMLMSWNLLVALFAGVAAQAVAVPTGNEHVDIIAKMSAERADPGDKVLLTVEVHPRSNIRVYATGASDYAAAKILLVPPKGIKMGRPKFPEPTRERTPGKNGKVPLYAREFLLSQEIEIDKSVKRDQKIKLAGSLIYQSCDDRVVFPQSTIPIVWTLTIKPEHDEDRDRDGRGSPDGRPQP